MSTSQKLKEAGVAFTSEFTMSNGFFGTIYKFPTIKDARKAGYEFKGGRKNYHITLY